MNETPNKTRDPAYGHDGETLAQAVDRLGDNIEDPFDRHTKSRGRWGWADLGHSIPNIFVAFTRERPKFAGKTIMYGALAAIVVVGAAVALTIMLL